MNTEETFLLIVFACATALLSAAAWWGSNWLLRHPAWGYRNINRWLVRSCRSQADRELVRDAVVHGRALADKDLRSTAFALASLLKDGEVRARQPRAVAVGIMNMLLAAAYLWANADIDDPNSPAFLISLCWVIAAGAVIKRSRPPRRALDKAIHQNWPPPPPPPIAGIG